METIDIDKAIPEIKKLLEIAAKGEEIIITKNNQPMVKIESIKNINQRPSLFGSDRDIKSITDDFDEPLEDFTEYM